MSDYIYFQDQENDELFISMVDDTTQREVSIPAVYILGKNGLVTSNPKISSKNIFFQAHDQKNSCPAEHGQCLGEHPSEHQQNCSSSTQPASMAGLVILETL